jgi:hypothetical protein
MPFITTRSKDPIGYLSQVADYYRRMEEAERARKAELYSMPQIGTAPGIEMSDIPTGYSEDRLADLQRIASSRKLKAARMAAPIEPLSYNAMMHPDEYEMREPQRRKQMADYLRAGTGMALGLGTAGMAPAALGGGLAARALSGAALNTLSSLPIYKADPSTADPLMDALMGAGLGVAGIPGMLLGGAAGWSPEVESGYAGGGLVRKGLEKFGALSAAADDYMPLASEATRPGVLGVIKGKGGNWLPKNIEQTLGNLKIKREPLDMAQTQWEELTPENNAINSWIEGPLKKYIQRDMATPDDPIRKLADQGILHVNPEQLNFRIENYGKWPLDTQSFMANPNSAAAKTWEGAADNDIIPSKAGYYQTLDKHIVDNPWISKLDPNTEVYSLAEPKYVSENLGFDHLVDELSNSLNPTSGLPRALQLRPEQMQQMGIDRAVRHVDSINKWRAAEMEKAQLADMAGIPVHKEYPEGYKWVELKHSEDPELTGKWLKSEGDTMGHCVGGYCPDVLEGRSRIFSLRDPKGQPHVTIETRPEMPRSEKSVDYWLNHVVDRDEGNKIWFDASQNPDGLTRQNFDKYVKTLPEYQEWIKGVDHDAIIQIKGKQNKAPIEQYLPYVQDFVKSQKWSDVGDLGNTGLRRSRDAFNENEIKTLRGIGNEIGEYLTAEEIEALQNSWPKSGMAEGGLVQQDADSLPFLHELVNTYDGIDIDDDDKFLEHWNNRLGAVR